MTAQVTIRDEMYVVNTGAITVQADEYDIDVMQGSEPSVVYLRKDAQRIATTKDEALVQIFMDEDWGVKTEEPPEGLMNDISA